MQYFDHSTGAATDPKVMQLRLEHGGAAVDAYWYILEQMHRDERPLCIRNANVMRTHSHVLCTDSETLGKWVSDMVSIGLLSTDESGENIVSTRAMGNISKYQEKQEKARSAAESRWGNANAMQAHKQTQCKRNADAMLTKQNKTNSSNANKSITTTRKAPSDAAAAKAAPTVAKDDSRAPHCPLCDALLLFDVKTGGWRCGVDGSILEGAVVWR